MKSLKTKIAALTTIATVLLLIQVSKNVFSYMNIYYRQNILLYLLFQISIIMLVSTIADYNHAISNNIMNDITIDKDYFYYIKKSVIGYILLMDFISIITISIYNIKEFILIDSYSILKSIYTQIIILIPIYIVFNLYLPYIKKQYKDISMIIGDDEK